MLTIKDQWVDYKESCVPPEAPDNIKKLVRSTFYAGSVSVLIILKELQGKTPAQINERIISMFNEVNEPSDELNS